MDNIVKIDIMSAEYPERLRMISDPPKQLYCKGDISLLMQPSIGVVGSRRFTVYGKNVALMIGRRLAEAGIPVVSGLALGIDAFSHQGVVEGEGRMIGVLGSGIDKMGPERNRGLMNKGLELGGLVISEYPPEMEANRKTFPQRNRIISGLSDALVVVEAGMESGSLITARFAAEQGRTVYAVPGNINSGSSIGCNLLIRDGAAPLVIIDDLLRDIGAVTPSARNAPANLDKDELKIYEAIAMNNGATNEDIIRDTGFDPSLVNSLLTVMEIMGIVESYAGRTYISR